MKKLVIVLFVLLAGLQHANATHYRAGVITYQLVAGFRYTYLVTVTTYTTNIYVPPDRDTVTISWGDNTQSPAPRINGQGQPLGNNIKVNIYQDTHTYAGPKPFYIISMNDPNRMDGILNIDNGNSVDVPFYIEDTLKFMDTPYAGQDNSPLLYNPPIYFGNVNDTFRQNPNAYDADGDSLSYELAPSLQAQGSQVPYYIFPDSVVPGIDDKMTIDPKTGEVVWATPKQAGPYNVAILIKEFRAGIEIGTELYDMMVIVEQEQNNPPAIQGITNKDTCVLAGTDLKLLLTAMDADTGQTVAFIANGGPIQDSTLGANATFNATNGIDTATGAFDWQTSCNDVRKQFYQVVFVATDNATYPLCNQVTYLVTVVGPSPQDLQADSSGNAIMLNWQSPYGCDSLRPSHFIGFSIWRAQESNSFTPDICNPGLAGSGYIEIDSLTTAYSFTDTGLVHGVNYCYRIQAEFADTTCGGYYYNHTPSLPSNEACISYQGITTLGINNPENELGVKLYPNPASDLVNIQFALAQPVEIIAKVYDVNGRVIFAETQTITTGKNNLVLNVKDFAAGIYAVQLFNTVTQQSDILKLVKQ